jgi:hypothetical protein
MSICRPLALVALLAACGGTQHASEEARCDRGDAAACAMMSRYADPDSAYRSPNVPKDVKVSEYYARRAAALQGDRPPPLAEPLPDPAPRHEPKRHPTVKPEPKPDAGWVTLQRQDLGFSLRLPATPRERTETVQLAIGPANAHIFALRHGDALYEITVLDEAALAQGNADALLDVVRDAAVRDAGAGAALQAERRLTVAGQPARQFDLALAAATQTIRIVVAPRAIVSLGFVPQTADAARRREAFLDSFQLLP